MPVMLALATSYAAYQAYCKQQKEQGEDEDLKKSATQSLNQIREIDPAIDLQGKTFVDLLPFEKSLSLLETSISTITFYDGNYKIIKQTLEKRVFDIMYRNPWLGGWIIQQQRKYPEDHQAVSDIQLMYDPSSDDIANPEQIFQCYDGDKESSHPIQISRDTTPYKDLISILGGQDSVTSSLSQSSSVQKDDTPTNPAILVPTSYELMNRSEQSLWRVSIIPDQHHPQTKFALVMSMSHVLGDARTFYQIYHMLSPNQHPRIQKLNPVRQATFMTDLEQFMGRQETYYVQNCISNPRWLSSIPSWTSMANANSQEHLTSSSKVSSLSPTSGNINTKTKNDDDDNSSMSLKGRIFYISMNWIQQRKLESRMLQQSPQTSLSSSVIPVLNARSTVSSNSIIVSWFFRILKTKVGLMTVNFIQDDIDAREPTDHHQQHDKPRERRNSSFQFKLPTPKCVGNYINTIPYSSVDYELPEDIEKSLETGKRKSYGDVHTKLYLANATTTVNSDNDDDCNEENDTTTFAVATNWCKWSWEDLDLNPPRRSLRNEKDDNTANCDNQMNNPTGSVGDDASGCYDAIKQVLHLPLYDGHILKSKLMNKMAFITVFTATCDTTENGHDSNQNTNHPQQSQRRLGAYIIAPKSIMSEIDSCGIIDEMIDHF